MTTCLQLHGEVVPKEGSALNCRLVGFSFAGSIPGTVKYHVEIARGNYVSELNFTQHIAQSLFTTECRVILEVPEFNSAYTWMVAYISANGGVTKSTLHHFSTLPLPAGANAKTRLLITKHNSKYGNALIFCDGSQTIYNMQGKPVWFLPELPENGDIGVRDMKLSPAGNITFLISKPYEVNYEGKLLWTVPAKQNDTDAGEGAFHHEFTVLGNGHRLAMASEEAVFHKSCTGFCDSNCLEFTKAKPVIRDSNHVIVALGTLVEYDLQGRIIWKWRSADYLKKSDVFFHLDKEGLTDIDMHANAFFLDEKNKCIYISFKNIDRIIAISYPAGQLLHEYGVHFRPFNDNKPNKGLFKQQHAVKISSKGDLYLYDNNTGMNKSCPKIELYKLPAGRAGELHKLWEADCFIEPGDSGCINNMARVGGNVLELPNNTFFVSMCKPFSNLFIINNKKQLTWKAILQKYDSASNKWVNAPSYRGSIITDKIDIQKMIWGAVDHANQITEQNSHF